MSKHVECRSVMICEIIVHLLVIVQNKKNYSKIILSDQQRLSLSVCLLTLWNVPHSPLADTRVRVAAEVTTDISQRKLMSYMKPIAVFRVNISFCLVGGYQHFGGRGYFNIRGRNGVILRWRWTKCVSPNC